MAAASARPNVSFAIARAPLSLTASDGTGLRLAELKTNAVVEGPLAFTEMRLVFENPQDRVLEGTFRIALPQGASISRFAMKIGEDYQEGEVVELQAARRAYEDFLHRKQDPALLEQAAGNEFSARVFPIPAKGQKEIILSYAQDLGEQPYTLALRGLPELGILDVNVTSSFAKRPVRLSEKSFTPASDFVVEPSKLGTTNAQALRNENLALVRVRPQAQSVPEPVQSAVLLVDTSASRALGFEEEVKVVADLAKELGKTHAKITIACFDQSVEPVFEGDAANVDGNVLAKIRDRGALGASDVEAALRWAATKGKKRVVLVSDGVATAGATDPKKLTLVASALQTAGVERLDAIAVGGIRDDAGLTRLVRGTLPHDGVVVASTMGSSVVARRLQEGTRSNIAVKVEGAKWSWPEKLDGMQAGDEITVYADVPAGQPLKVVVGSSAPVTFDARPVERPILERAWAQARIASLLEREATSKDDLKKEIIDLSVKNRVLSPYTALLVLETDADYARFNIDRRALTDILAIKDNRVVRAHRTYKELPLAVGARDVDLPEVEEDKPLAPGAAPPRPSSPPPSQPSATAPRMEAAKTAEAKADAAPPAEIRLPRPPPRPSPRPDSDDDDGPVHGVDPYTGKFKTVMTELARKNVKGALETAKAWRAEEPGDVMALVALGESLEASGATATAARAYGSIIDLFSNRADLRRFAGERLERLQNGAGLPLAIDSYAKAAEQRPDHPASHRLLAFSLVKNKEYAKGFDAIAKGANNAYEVDRFRGVDRILKEDLGLIAAAWIAAEPNRRDEILARLKKEHGTIENAPSVRFVLNWETDANDVDFHIHDAKGGHAFFGKRMLQSGGELYADVTTGYGPECFTIRKDANHRAGPYKLEAHYYSRGPMGYGMGKLQIIEHDGKGGLRFEERPFVVMADGAYVNLGTVK